MNDLSPSPDLACFDDVITQLVDKQYAIIDNLLPSPLLCDLEQHFDSIDAGEFKRAGIGRSENFQTNSTIRTDLIRWLDRDSSATTNFLDWMEALRQRVNRELFLGLFDYECHYAHFPHGSFYRRHVDAFRGEGNRRLTTILYLNHGWQVEDGGELKMYEDDAAIAPFATVLPQYGRMVIFLSEEFPHEVCVAHRSRRSVTGWFRINNSHSRQTDPMR